jgi:hypothetical protein
MDKTVIEWAENTKGQLLRKLAKLGVKEKSKLVKSLKTKFKQKDGELERVSFSFTKHGIFYERGVGRGRGIQSGKTKPNPWLKPILDAEIEQLADLIAEKYADLAVEELKLNIPGIISTKVKIG